MSNQHCAPYALTTIHSREYHSLVAEYSATDQAIQKATDALLRTGVYRDFYSEDDAAWRQALDERAEMFRKLAELRAYANAWKKWARDQVETVA